MVTKKHGDSFETKPRAVIAACSVYNSQRSISLSLSRSRSLSLTLFLSLREDSNKLAMNTRIIKASNCLPFLPPESGTQ